MRASIDNLRQDLGYAVRTLHRQAGLTATVVLVLAAAIGLNTTFFTVLAGITLRPWPGIAEPSTIVRVYLQDQSGRADGFSLADVRALAGGTKTLAGITAMKNDSVRIGAADAVVPANALMVSGNFFTLLGITVAQGRGFLEQEDRLGAPSPVTILGHDFWQTRFGGDPAVVGQTLRLNDVLFTIVGVAGRDFTHSEPFYDKALFLPMSAMSLLRPGDAATQAFLHNPDSCCVDVVARLGEGGSRAQTVAELNASSREFLSFSGTPARGVLVTGTEFLAQPGRGDSSQALLSATLLTLALLLVWLIACANVGNLLLARAAARTGEIGIRLALGAGRGRVVRQLLTEGLVLALAAAAIGVAIAYQLPFLVFRIVADSGTVGFFPFSVRPDAVVLGYAVLLAALSSVIFGLAPALAVTRADVASALKQREGWTVSRIPLRGVLLAVQVAVSVVLLVGAGLLIRGVQRQAGVFDPGFAVEGLTTVTFDMPEGVYDRARSSAFFAELTQGLGDLPIEAFAFSSHEPFSRYRNGTMFHLPGETRAQARLLLFLDVSPEYLNVLRIPLLAGRTFDAADAGTPAVVINEAMARRYWPGGDPIGQTFFIRPPGPVDQMVPREIIGVARNVRTSTSDNVLPMFYRPLAPGTEVFDYISRDPRASHAPALLIDSDALPSAEIARMVARLDPRVRVQSAPLSAARDTMLASARWGPILAAALGAFALALATVGLFGVFAYAVRLRRREIGIRMALGAPPSAVVRLVLSGHSRAVAVGLAAGLAGGVAASMIMRSRLHGLSPFDPVAYLAVGSLLVLAALAASYVPARRVTRVNPLEVLRQE